MVILVVDDSSTMRRIIKNTLRQAGYTNVIEAIHGKDGIAKLNAEKIDFILTDWNMPEMNGLEFVKAVKADSSFKDIPILMITTRSVKEDIIMAMKAGVSSYIVKPFTAPVIKDKIEQILSNL